MPSRFVLRDFTEGGVYHIHNRGIENRTIFTFEDFKIFTKYLYIYVKPLDAIADTYPETSQRLLDKNLSAEVDVLAYCLMPSHFHLILRQHTKDGISKLMKQITNAYTEYFNNKFHRTGPLFQGRFRATALDVDKTLLPLSRYVHQNPKLAGLISNLEDYPWSSFPQYADGNIEGVVKKRVMLSFFASSKQFVEYTKNSSGLEKDMGKLRRVIIEEPETLLMQIPNTPVNI